jgi:hypothetical protein
MTQVLRTLSIFLLTCMTAAATASAYPRQNQNHVLRQEFFRLCSLATAKITARRLQGPFFVDSYAVRALCVAYDMTGRPIDLDASLQWCRRMMNYQKHMIPAGAYYMNYNRRPGRHTGDWYVADSSSIAMALVATAVRCHGIIRQHLLDSAERFAALVRKHYVRPSGGVSDGLWAQSHHAWWCSSALFGSLSFVLYANTGKRRYLKTGLRIVKWLNRQNLNRQHFFPLSQQGPAMIMYVMECYSAGWPYIENSAVAKPALAKVNWCLNWITRQQRIPPDRRQWPVDQGWGMKFGGLPFHEYIFSHYLPPMKADQLTAAADLEMRRLSAIIFRNRRSFSQLSAFLMMSYAQRLDPGAIYRNCRPSNASITHR